MRFEQRFKFQISKLTANLINNAVRNNFFDRLSGARLFQELKLILQEENPIPAVARLGELDLLKAVHPRLAYDEAAHAMLERVQAVLSWYDLLFLEDHYQRWLVYFLGLVEPFSAGELAEMLRIFNLPPKPAGAMVQGKEAADQALLSLFRLGSPTAARSTICWRPWRRNTCFTSWPNPARRLPGGSSRSFSPTSRSSSRNCGGGTWWPWVTSPGR